MLHVIILNISKNMPELRHNCFAIFRPQNVKWIAFGNVVILVMMIKVLTFNNGTKYVGVDSIRSNLTEQLAELRKEIDNSENDHDKLKSINLWKQLMAGNEWFSLRLPSIMENGEDVLQFFRPLGAMKVKSKEDEIHCDLCVGGKPEKEITSSAFLQMYQEQCELERINVTRINTTLPTCTCVPKNLRKYMLLSTENEICTVNPALLSTETTVSGD